MRPIATDGIAWSLCRSVCVFGHVVREPCRSGGADQRNAWRVTPVHRRNHVLHGGQLAADESIRIWARGDNSAMRPFVEIL